MEAIVLLGPPGSGKGTAAGILEETMDFRHISTGELFRESMRDGSEIGTEIRPYMEEGQLVPDGLVLHVIEDVLKVRHLEEQVLFDGFPRTLIQAEAFESLLEKTQSTLTQVFLLEAREELLIARMGGRLVCSSCGTIFNMTSIPPNQSGHCDTCGASLAQREDDIRGTIRQRLKIYRGCTAPLADYYTIQGLLRRVDADASPSNTVGQILACLDDQGKRRD